MILNKSSVERGLCHGQIYQVASSVFFVLILVCTDGNNSLTYDLCQNIFINSSNMVLF